MGVSSPERLVVVVHIPQEAMESYVTRTLPDLETEPLQVHLFICQECRDRFVTLLSAAERKWRLCWSEQAEYDTVQDELRREGPTCRGAPSGRSSLFAGDQGIEPDAANKPSVRL